MGVGITFNSFDLLDSRHMLMLKEAKKQCEYLIVGLNLNLSIDRPGKNTPSQTITNRYIQLKESKYIDEIIPYFSEQDIDDILRLFKIDICIIGEDNKTVDFIGKEYCNKKGIKIYYISKEHRFSSLEDNTAINPSQKNNKL